MATKSKIQQVLKRVNKPDAATISSVNQVKLNPKFVKMMVFSTNVLGGLTKLPNTKHRDNVAYILKEAVQKNIIQALLDHVSHEGVLLNSILLLNNIIGADKFREEKIAASLIDDGLLQNLVGVLNHNKANISKDVLKAIYDLLCNITLSQQLSLKVSQCMLLDPLLEVPITLKTTSSETRKILQLVLQILEIPSIRQQIQDVGGLAAKSFILLKHYHKDLGLATIVLKIIESLVQQPNHVEQITSKRIIGTQELVELLSAYQKSEINMIGARILLKLLTKAELAVATESLKQPQQKDAQQIQLISNLILADHSYSFDESLLTDIFGILKYHQSAVQDTLQVEIMEYCLITILRISLVDINQIAPISDELNDVLLTLLDSNQPAIQYNALNCLRIVGVSVEGNYEHLYSRHLLEKTIRALKANLVRADIQAVGLQLLVATSTDAKAISAMSSENFVQVILRIFDRHPRHREITENGSRLLYVLSNEQSNAYELSKQESVRVIVEQLFICHQQRLVALYLLKIINVVLFKEGEAKKNYREANLPLALVSVIIGRGFSINKGVIHVDTVGDAEDDEQRPAVMNQKQMDELVVQSRNIIDKLISEQEIIQFTKELESYYQRMVSYSEVRMIDVEVAIYKLANVVLVPQLGMFTLKIDFFNQMLKMAGQFLKMRDFPEKVDLLIAVLKLISNMSQIYWEQDARDLYREKEVTKLSMELLLQIAQIDNERVIIEVLRTFIKMVSINPEHHHMMKHLINKKCLLDIVDEAQMDPLVTRILERVSASMKNYHTSEPVQLKCLELLKAYLYFDRFEQRFLNDTSLKLITQRINEDTTSKEFGIVAVGVLYTVAYKSKATIAQFAKQNLITKVLDFVRSYGHSYEVRQAATPIILLLGTADMEKLFSKESEAEIESLIAACKQDREDFSVLATSANLAQLSTYAMVDVYFQFMCSAGFLSPIIDLIKLCNQDPYYETFSTDSILVSSFQILSKMCRPSGISKTQHIMNIQQLIDCKATQLATKAMSVRAYNQQVVFEVLLFLDEASANKELVFGLVEEIETQDLLQTFMQKSVNEYRMLQRHYRDHTELIKVQNRILLNLIRKSEKTAKRPQLQGFIRNLIQRTKTWILFDTHSKEQVQGKIVSQQILQSLVWLWHLSQIASPLHFMKQEQCVDLCFSIVRFEVSIENIMIIKKKGETTRKSLNQAESQDPRYGRKSTIRKTEQRQKSESQPLQYSLKLLNNLCRGEQSESLEQWVQSDRMDLLIRILNNLSEDAESIENAVKLIQEILVGEEMMHRFKALDGITALQNVKIATTNNLTRELITKLIDQVGEDDEISEMDSDEDDEEEEVEEVKPIFTKRPPPTINISQVEDETPKAADVGRPKTPGNRQRMSKRMSKFIKIEDITVGGETESVLQSLKDTIKQQLQEMERLSQANNKKQQEIDSLNSRVQDLQEENKNYHDEIVDQTRVLTEKIMQLKNEQSQVRRLEEQVKKLNEFTGGEELQAQQQDLAQQLEYVQVQNSQLEMLCEQQLTELEQLNQVKNEQDLLIQELQKTTNYEKTAFEQIFTKEDVGTPEDSEHSEVDRLEQEIEQKDQYIQQLAEQLQEAQQAFEKVKFLEDKTKTLKEKLQAAEHETSKNFWDLEIVSTGSSLLSLVKDKWSFLMKNSEGVADYHQQITVLGFDSHILQRFIDVGFNYSKQLDGIYNTLSDPSIAHIKVLTPSFLHNSKGTKKQQQTQAFLLAAKLLQRGNYAKGYGRQIGQHTDDQTAQEEFWFQFCFQQPGTVVFVCQQLGLEEIELIRRLSYLQVVLGHRRLLIYELRDDEFTPEQLKIGRQLCGELQMIQSSNEDSIVAQRALLEVSFKKTTESEVQLFLQAVIKHDNHKLKQEYTFVDQIREYIIKQYPNFFDSDAEPDFKIEQANDAEGFELTLLLGDAPKLKRNRPTTIITTQSILNIKFEENGEVHVEIFAPAGEVISQQKVKVAYVVGQGTKIHTSIHTNPGIEDEEYQQKYWYLNLVPQWYLKVKSLDNQGHKLLIVLEQDLEAAV